MQSKAVLTGVMAGIVVSLLMFAGFPPAAQARISPGKALPDFSLTDLEGGMYSLSAMQRHPLLIIYFFDATSRTSQEALLTLDRLVREHAGADLRVWGVTQSSRQEAEDFVRRSKPSFPILLDDGGVSQQYQARVVLPTTCIVGPGLVLLDLIQGAGQSTNVMLVRVAERSLQQREAAFARALGEEVARQNPDDARARQVVGYAALKQGDTQAAEQTFDSLARETGEAGISGTVGLSAVYVARGENDKALRLAKEAQQRDPDNGYVHVLKGDVLYAQARTAEAEAEYHKAVEKPAAPLQQAEACNKLGLLAAAQGQHERSRSLYDQAYAIDPFNIEALSNKGRTYEKQGDWDKALDLYRQAQTLDKNDLVSEVLARRAQEMQALARDGERSQRMDALVKDLAKRYREQVSSPEPQDTWTSQPLVLSFVDFQESGAISLRDGFATVLTTRLGELLNASGRVQVVERALIERLLEELNLGSSELADPETALRLGRVLAARITGTGSLYHLGGSSLLSLRLIDTETTAIPKVINRQLDQGDSLNKALHELNREILAAVIKAYPIRGYVVEALGDEVMINLGARQGIVTGTTFEVIEEGRAVAYKGRTLKGAPKTIGQIEVLRVEPDLAFCRIVSKDRPLLRDDKVIEKGAPSTIQE